VAGYADSASFFLVAALVSGLDLIPDGILLAELAPSGGHVLFLTPATESALADV
jgi:hypothetical protein